MKNQNKIRRDILLQFPKLLSPISHKDPKRRTESAFTVTNQVMLSPAVMLWSVRNSYWLRRVPFHQACELVSSTSPKMATDNPPLLLNRNSLHAVQRADRTQVFLQGGEWHSKENLAYLIVNYILVRYWSSSVIADANWKVVEHTLVPLQKITATSVVRTLQVGGRCQHCWCWCVPPPGIHQQSQPPSLLFLLWERESLWLWYGDDMRQHHGKPPAHIVRMQSGTDPGTLK